MQHFMCQKFLLRSIKQQLPGVTLARLLPLPNDEYFPHDVNRYKIHNPQTPQ